MTEEQAKKIDDVLYQLSDAKTGRKGMLTNKMMGDLRTAIKKQVPKVVKLEPEPGDDCIYCPACYAFLFKIEDLDDWEDDYCYACGQKLTTAERNGKE